MKVFVKVPPDVSEWFESTATLDELRSWLMDLNRCSILQVNATRHGLRATLQKMELTESKRLLFEAILAKLPIASDLSRVRPDAEILGHKSSNPFGTALINKVKVLEDHRTAAFDSRTTLVAGYKRTIGYLAAGANSIEILDPYAGTAICDSQFDRLWMLRQLCESGVASIHIVTSIPRNAPDRERLSRRQWRKLIQDELAILSREYSLTITFECYVPNNFFHNRRLLFVYSDGAIGCLLEKGIDGFATEPFEAGSAVKPLTEAEYYLARRGVEDLELVT
mgnify:CR=1 FL=1